MRTIYIVEDDENIRELVLYALKSSNFRAFGFENGNDFWTEMEDEQPDLIILDIMLPDEDGLSLLKKLKNRGTFKKIPVILLTAKSGEFDKVKGLDQGADDYITKPFGVMELISRINAVLRRSVAPQNPEQLTYQTIRLDLQRHLTFVEEDTIDLTLKEFELLHYLMLNHEFVLSRDKIMEAVWRFDFEGESRTVDMHIKTLRQKLGKAGEAIKTIRGVGYTMR